MEIKVIEGKKYFFVKYDKEYVVNQLKEMRDSYENYYVEYGIIPESGGSYLSKEEYEKNYDPEGNLHRDAKTKVTFVRMSGTPLGFACEWICAVLPEEE